MRLLPSQKSSRGEKNKKNSHTHTQQHTSHTYHITSRHFSGDEKGDSEAQLEASEFIRNTLANEKVKDLEKVGELANKLSEKAIRICAGVCGLPSEEAFRAAANNITPESLEELRRGLRSMGV